MVGKWGLEPQTSTVSNILSEVIHCTYKALVAAKGPAGCRSSGYCGLNVLNAILVVALCKVELDFGHTMNVITSVRFCASFWGRVPKKTTYV